MHIDALSVLCAQLTRDLLAIAKFLLRNSQHFCSSVRSHYVFNSVAFDGQTTALYSLSLDDFGYKRKTVTFVVVVDVFVVFVVVLSTNTDTALYNLYILLQYSNQ